MTFAQVVDPGHWPEGWRWVVGGLAAIALTIFGAGQFAGGLSTKIENLNGTMIEVKQKVDTAVTNQATQRDLTTAIQSNIKTLGDSVTDVRNEQRQVKEDLVTQQQATAKIVIESNKELQESADRRAHNLPRIDALEKGQQDLEKNLAVFGQKLDDIKETAHTIQTTTVGHDQDIKAIKRAVVPPSHSELLFQ